MSQTCYVGVNGSGKTHAAVLEIIRSLRNGVNKDGSIREGRHVYTNIEGMNEDSHFHCLMMMTNLCEAELRDRFHWYPDAEIVKAVITEAVEGALIVIDECHEHISNRKWQSDTNEKFALYGAKHRHQHHDLILITQHIGKIDTHVRTNSNWTFFFRKIDFFGSLVKKGYLCYAYNGDNHDGQPICPPQKKFYRDDVHKCYKSTVNSEIKEMGLTHKINVLNRPIFWIIPILICTCLYYIFNNKSLLRGGAFTPKPANAASLVPGAKIISKPAPVFSNTSSIKSVPVANVVTAPSLPPVPMFTLVKITGYLKSENDLYINIGTTSIKLPSPHVRNVDLSMSSCEMKTEFYNLAISKKNI